MPRDYQLPHKLTRWRSDGQRDIYGQTGYTVEVLKCRYTEVSRMYVDYEGEEKRSTARIYTQDDMLEIGDMVIKGDFACSPQPVKGSYEIKNRRVIDNQRGTRTEWRYIC